MREWCEAIRILLASLVFKKPSLVWIKEIVAKFEVLHGILVIIGSIDDRYIPIIARSYDLISYYC